LRERRDDVPLLVDHFLKRFTSRPLHSLSQAGGLAMAAEYSPVQAISPDAMAALCEYSWPGNVRQVENVVERLVVTVRREVITLDDLSPEIRVPGQVNMRPRRE